MAGILVLAEHRRGEIRDITFEMLNKGRALAEKANIEMAAVLMGNNVGELAEKLKDYAKKVLVVQNEMLKEFNSETYQKALSTVIAQEKPLLTMIGHTSFGMDLTPSLSTALNIPLTTDCIDVDIVDGKPVVQRQVYGGKVNQQVNFRESEGYMVMVRPGVFPPDKPEPAVGGDVVTVDVPLSDEDVKYKKFIEYLEEAKGDVDITAADIIVTVGRGIKDVPNIPLVEDFAKAIGGILASTRPIVDKGWLPKDRQVGISGKTVKPKLYIAMGVSGAFQHVTGMKGSKLIIAINKDPKAPIFNVADYGIVDDIFKVLPVLKDKILESKSS